MGQLKARKERSHPGPDACYRNPWPSGKPENEGTGPKLGVTTGTLTVIIGRLEQNGLISRRPNENDRRSIVVVLTEKGQKYFKEDHKLHLELTHEITSSLTENEAGQLYTFLEKLVSLL